MLLLVIPIVVVEEEEKWSLHLPGHVVLVL
jgi:hypothetical protein